MIKLSGGQQKCVSSQTPHCVWERCHFIKKNFADGKVQRQNFKSPLLVVNYWESMEKQLNSSGISYQDLRHCRFFRRSRMFCESGTLNLRNSQTESSLCQCSTIGQGKEMMDLYFEFRKSQGIREEILAITLTFLGLGDEKKWYGTLPYTREGQWDSTATQMVDDSKILVIQCSRVLVLWVEEFREKKEWQRHHTL